MVGTVSRLEESLSVPSQPAGALPGLCPDESEPLLSQRPGLDDLYPRHPSPSLGDGYGPGAHYYQGFPQPPPEDTGWHSGGLSRACLGTGPWDPVKFSARHVPVGFGPGGQLVLGAPRDGRPALVELHSVEVILNDSEEQEEMRTFSGPLKRDDVYKVDVMTFCQRKAEQSCRAESPRGRDSALLWKLLVLLCRQNGSMVGSDIADLLMQDCRKLDRYQRQPPVANLIGLDSDEDWPALSLGTPNLLTGEIPPSVETPAQVVEKFTKLLYFGRKKEALEWAMKNHLWGHALFLSSKMDARTYNWVMSGFISTLALNDPLQTFFQLMSGRIPQAAMSCGDQQWGDWRPHLAMVLSNQAAEPELQRRAIVTLGDTLASKGLVEAAHFCYLMAHVPFGYYPVKTDPLVLLGSSHSQAFLQFATTEAIQRTETFEYCRTLGRPQASIPSFQVYKLLYAARLADHGLASQALQYCEAVGTAVLGQGGDGHPVLLAELIKLAERLKFSDPLLEPRLGHGDSEPEWLVQLRRHQEALQAKGASDAEDPASVYPAVSGAGRAGAGGPTDEPRNSLPGGLPGPGGDPEGLSDGAVTSFLQPPLEPPGPYSADGAAGPVGVPVPLYPVPPAAVPRAEKQGSGKENPKGSGFGWFSWFRSKPSSSSSSGDEDPSDTEDPPGADPGPALTPSSAFQPLTDIAGGPGDVLGPLPSLGAADGSRTGGLPGPAARPSEFNPGFLLPPPNFQGAVPLYNPAQMLQLSTVPSQNRPNRLAQRRYPTQPAVL
ncbi:protein transport protein Sec16B [Sorex araneus]|uniref:protein transport protein Sec16B n=1 Tax=Sorex araneus TaxID=42254 RepID=UPI002433DDCF|nr:protein transport protein Sec16B [Sorex araneus]